MRNTDFCGQIVQYFPHTPTPDQTSAMENLSAFLANTEAEGAFLLKGYAGTGKTSLIGALVKALTAWRQKCLLLAPTGRAAKVFSAYAEQPAFTIHKKIYRQKSFSGQEEGFTLANNLHKHTLFLVDEASMISDGLLEDLLHYVYSGEGCRLILIGDEAQLPPVGLDYSPALNPARLHEHNLQVTEFKLQQVVRQAEDSGILYNATCLRQALQQKRVGTAPHFRLNIGNDLRKIGGAELLEEISSAYDRDGIDETLVVVRSNKRANMYNAGIRNRILYREEELSSGDLLMVAKNNYYWLAGSPEESEFIANGEMIEVLRVHKVEERYGFRFADVRVRFRDYESETDMKILLDTLQAEAPALPREASDRLFHAVWDEYADIPRKAERLKKVKNDPYFNVVQVKYAYSITCHKAQGGQWKNVFLDIGYVPENGMGEDFYRWLYTALTRSSSRLYLINLPKMFEEPLL
ncbi:MAG: AAA family ATPase [Tannerella sp.]|jgi:exodeoxyribonuclease-5|nr:AAA family ATPase [Tannerella sp.]